MSEHKCFCSNCKTPETCPLNAAINQYNAVVEQNKSLQQDLLSCNRQAEFTSEQIKHFQDTILEEGKENPTCPSYDFGNCETSPHPFAVKCRNLSECKWKKTDFREYEFVNGEWKEKENKEGESHEQ